MPVHARTALVRVLIAPAPAVVAGHALELVQLTLVAIAPVEFHFAGLVPLLRVARSRWTALATPRAAHSSRPDFANPHFVAFDFAGLDKPVQIPAGAMCCDADSLNCHFAKLNHRFLRHNSVALLPDVRAVVADGRIHFESAHLRSPPPPCDFRFDASGNCRVVLKHVAPIASVIHELVSA